MFNSFPQPKPDTGGGLLSPLDWSAYETVYDWSGALASIPASSWGTFLNIAGEGYLSFFQAYAISNVLIPDVRVTIDGVSYVFSGYNGGDRSIGNILNHPIYFKNSLKIEVYNSIGTAPFACDYTYLLKKSSANPSKNTILQASARNMAYNMTSGTTDTAVANVSGSGYLLAIEVSGNQITALDTTAEILLSISIDTVAKMTSKSLFRPGGYGYKLHYFAGPVRFNSQLFIRHKVSNANAAAISRVWYTLD